MPAHEIKNFHRVDDRLGTGGQPTELQLHEVAQEGYQVVVNLGLLDPKYCLPDEAALVAKLGLVYHHIPVKFDDPRGADFQNFVAIMDASLDASLDARAAKRTFVHCALNWRVSSFVGLYGQLRMGWSEEVADAHARRFWPLNEIWLKFMADRRHELGLEAR